MEYLSSLMQKEVINVTDGSKLGYIVDLELDICCGKIICLIVKSRKCSLTLFTKKENIYRIELKDVIKIGDETILIKNFFCDN